MMINARANRLMDNDSRSTPFHNHDLLGLLYDDHFLVALLSGGNIGRCSCEIGAGGCEAWSRTRTDHESEWREQRRENDDGFAHGFPQLSPARQLANPHRRNKFHTSSEYFGEEA